MEHGYKLSWGPKTPSPETRQGMGTGLPPRDPPWEIHLAHPPSPAPNVPSSPRGRHTWLLLGSRWRGHSPACPACQAPRGRRGGLYVPVGEEEDGEHPWAEQQGQGRVLRPMSPGSTLP